jgi:ABC-2 type transport system permease protein
MTIAKVRTRAASAAPAGPRTRAITALAVRQLRRGAVVVLLLAAGLSALVAVQYRDTFAEAFDVASLRALAENPAIRVLFGAPVALEDPGGFTVWRTGTFAAVLVGVWALLTATRITRGEEDARRWDLLLAGRLRLRTLVARHLTVLVAALALIGAAVAAAMILAGTQVTGSALYGLALALVGVGYAALGTLLAQLVATRQTAAGLAAAALGAGLLLRMIADLGPAAGWLRWSTPFGLLAQVQPYAADRAAPLVVLTAVGAGLCAAALAAAGRRDVGAGLFPVEDTRAARPRLLRSLPRFAVRRVLRGLAGWAAGLAAYSLLIGLLAVSLTDFLADNARFADLAAQAGFAHLGTVEGYVGALFGLLPIPLGAYAAARVAADAAEEIDRRLTLLFALPVSRLRWIGTEAAVIAVACALLAATAGVAVWVGTVFVGAALGLPAALAGALNALPVTLLCLGAALLALGWWPQAALPVGLLPAAGGFLLQLLAETFRWPSWVARLSPFAHVASVPAAPPDWLGAAGLLAVAAGLAALGTARYTRRDLRG